MFIRFTVIWKNIVAFLKKNFMACLYVWGPIVSRLQSHYEEIVYFLLLSPQKSQLLISLTLEGWKAGSACEPPSDFEPGTPGYSIMELAGSS